MGKRSNFDRIPRDFYPTPAAAVAPLIPHLVGIRTFGEPAPVTAIWCGIWSSYGLHCVYQGDIATGQDALALASTATLTPSSPTRPGRANCSTR